MFVPFQSGIHLNDAFRRSVLDRVTNHVFQGAVDQFSLPPDDDLNGIIKLDADAVTWLRNGRFGRSRHTGFQAGEA